MMADWAELTDTIRTMEHQLRILQAIQSRIYTFRTSVQLQQLFPVDVVNPAPEQVLLRALRTLNRVDGEVQDTWHEWRGRHPTNTRILVGQWCCNLRCAGSR